MGTQLGVPFCFPPTKTIAMTVLFVQFVLNQEVPHARRRTRRLSDTKAMGTAALSPWALYHHQRRVKTSRGVTLRVSQRTFWRPSGKAWK